MEVQCLQPCKQQDSQLHQCRLLGFILWYFFLNDILANAVRDTVQNLFQLFVDPIFGVQYSGQYSQHVFFSGAGTPTATDPPNTAVMATNMNFFNNAPNIFFHLWFYTCKTEDFVIFSMKPPQAFPQHVFPYYTSQGGYCCPNGNYPGGFFPKAFPTEPTPFNDEDLMTIGVDGNGYIFFIGAFSNNEAKVQITERTTNLKVAAGWNYIAMDIDEIYEYSYINMYHRNEQTVCTTNCYTKYSTEVQGYYSDSRNYKIIEFGCRTTYDYIATSVVDDQAYGACMRGSIRYMSTYGVATGAVFTTYALRDTWIYTNGGLVATLGRFAFWGEGAGNLFYLDNTLTVQQTLLYKWDGSSATIGQTGATSIQPTFTCTMGLTSGASTNPYYQPGIG